MIGITNAGGGGGGSLNFKVVGGTAQPTNPSENMIWVNTSVAITSWVFSATAPTSPAAGMVWFATGSSSSVAFNAVKKNGIWVYPAGCQQYVSGAWVTKTAKTYQSGAWKDWVFWLYKDGMKEVEFADNALNTIGTTSLTWGDTSATFAGTGKDNDPSGTTWFSVWTNTPLVDVSAYTKLICKLGSLNCGNATWGSFNVGLVRSTQTELAVAGGIKDAVAETYDNSVDGAAKTITLDISNVTGEAAAVMGLRFQNNTYQGKFSASAEVRQFWFE